jgi:hypothetical protein
MASAKRNEAGEVELTLSDKEVLDLCAVLGYVSTHHDISAALDKFHTESLKRYDMDDLYNFQRVSFVINCGQASGLGGVEIEVDDGDFTGEVKNPVEPFVFDSMDKFVKQHRLTGGRQAINRKYKGVL